MVRLVSTFLCASVTLAASVGRAQTRIAPGETASGALTASDRRMASGAHADLWSYEGARGERIVITLRSIQFDAYVMVQLYPGGSRPLLARDDDGGRGSDARVELTLPDDDDYLITVTTAERGQTGAYRLSVQSSRTAAQASRLVGAPAAATAKPSGEGKRSDRGTRLLEPGRTVVETLTSALAGPLGASEGDWRYLGQEGETITVDMRSSEFDPFLTVYSLGGRSVERVAQDDNGGGRLNSRIVYRIPADGEYVVRAERRQPGSSGSYTLVLSSSARAARLGARAEGNQTIAANSSVGGELDGSDPKMHDGTPYELWTYVGRAGETIRITLHSNDFDTFVSLGTVTDGVFAAIESADDGAGGTDSRLETTLPFAGEYAIRANSLSPRRAMGDYVLRVESLR